MWRGSLIPPSGQHRAATVRERTRADTRDLGPLRYGRGSVLRPAPGAMHLRQQLIREPDDVLAVAALHFSDQVGRQVVELFLEEAAVVGVARADQVA